MKTVATRRSRTRVVPGVELARRARTTPARDRARMMTFTADPSLEPLRVKTYGTRREFPKLSLQRGVYLTMRANEHGTYTLIDGQGREVAEIEGVPLLSYETAAPRRDLWPEIRAAFAEILIAADASDTQPVLYRGWLPYPKLPSEHTHIPVGYNSTFDITDDWSERVTRGSASTAEGSIELEVHTDSARLPVGSARRMLSLKFSFGESTAWIALPAEHADAFEALVTHVLALARTDGTLPKPGPVVPLGQMG